MIEGATIRGRPAFVAYLDENFDPVDRAKAVLAKAVFIDDEGGSLFLAAVPPEEKDFDEGKHPRVPAGSPEGGQFTSGGGGEGSAEEKPAPAPAEPKLTAEVIAVGGDEWNKATARRLEREYQDARPKVDKLAIEAPTKTGGTPVAPLKVGEDVEEEEEEEEGEPPYEPEEWDMLSASGQSAVEEAYYDQNKQSYIDSEIDNYWNEQGPDDARAMVAENFNDDAEKHGQWAMDALNEMEQRFPFGNHELLDAMSLNYESGYGGGSWGWKKHFQVLFDDAKLREIGAAREPEGTQQLPGFEPPDYAKLLTKEMRDDIAAAITEAFESEADDQIQHMEAPEYLAESAEDFMKTMWEELSDKDKFEFAKKNTEVIEEESTPGTGSYAQEKPAATVEELKTVDVPEKYDPLNETSGTNYRRTQAMARYLSVERAAQVIMDRNLVAEPKGDEAFKEKYLKGLKRELAIVDTRLWSAWKSSSTSENGQLLQLATAEELGGRLNYKTHPQVEIKPGKLMKDADRDYSPIGGYAGIKAYIRAKWEVTQYMLDKAGMNTLQVYRGIKMYGENYDAAMRAQQDVKEVSPATGNILAHYTKLPTIKIDRNGAASTSTDNKVASDWDGHSNRVVLRAEVPRTAAISVPAYGINIHSEHEVVVAGTAWKSWDAWHGKAPTFEQIPIGANGTGIGDNAPMPKAA